MAFLPELREATRACLLTAQWIWLVSMFLNCGYEGIQDSISFYVTSIATHRAW